MHTLLYIGPLRFWWLVAASLVPVVEVPPWWLVSSWLVAAFLVAAFLVVLVAASLVPVVEVPPLVAGVLVAGGCLPGGAGGASLVPVVEVPPLVAGVLVAGASLGGWWLPSWFLARIFTAGHAGGGTQGSSVRRRSRL